MRIKSLTLQSFQRDNLGIFLCLIVACIMYTGFSSHLLGFGLAIDYHLNVHTFFFFFLVTEHSASIYWKPSHRVCMEISNDYPFPTLYSTASPLEEWDHDANLPKIMFRIHWWVRTTLLSQQENFSKLPENKVSQHTEKYN